MIQKLDWSHDNILAYEASGILTKEENIAIFDDISAIIQKCGKVRLFIRLPELALPELRAIGVRLRFAKEHLKDIERYTVVTNSNLVKTFSKLARFMPRMQFRCFDIAQEADARKWLESGNYKSKPDPLLMTSLAAITATIFLLTIRLYHKSAGGFRFKKNH